MRYGYWVPQITCLLKMRTPSKWLEGAGDWIITFWFDLWIVMCVSLLDFLMLRVARLLWLGQWCVSHSGGFTSYLQEANNMATLSQSLFLENWILTVLHVYILHSISVVLRFWTVKEFFTQDNWPSVLFAMAGGVVLSVGNLSTQYAWAFVGLSVVEVVTSSITVVIGIISPYRSMNSIS